MKSHHFILGIIAAAIISLLLYIGCGNITGGGGGGGGTATYTLGISITPEGWGTGEVSPTGEVTLQGIKYAAGTIVTVTAEGTSGHIFDHWGGDLSGSTETATITMDADKDIIASFQHIYYHLSVSVTPEGSGTVEPWGGDFIDSTYALLTAEAAGEYVFSSWEGDASGTSTTTTVLMNGNKNVTARFIKTYSLGISVVPTGWGTVEPYGGEYSEGSTAVITAEGVGGHVFSSWEGDASGTSDTAAVLMDGNKNVTASFKLPHYTDNGDHTITDNTTGKMWIQNINYMNPPFPSPMTWYDATKECDALIYAGHDDWRLPTASELNKIVDSSRSNPAIDPIFIETRSDIYWTIDPDMPGWYVGINFSNGSFWAGSGSHYARPIRP
jgi:hypothetical protein